MKTSIDIRDLPARLDEAVKLASAGKEVILFDGSTPRARLVALQPTPPRVPGLHTGALQTTSDFDAPLDDNFWSGRP